MSTHKVNRGGIPVNTKGKIVPVNSTFLPLKLSLQYYLKLFTSQYQLSVNLLAWQKAMQTPIDDLTTCLQQVNMDYALDQATGVQLDTIGQFIGVTRKVPFQPSGGVSPILTDTDYRTLLQATILMNT